MKIIMFCDDFFIFLVYFFSYSTGDPRISTNPPAEHKFIRNPKGYDKRGGGAVIPCTLELSVKPGEVENVKKKLFEFFKDYKGTETLVIDDLPYSCPKI